MCGIAGLFGRDSYPLIRTVTSEMIGGLRNRGPDGDGVWHCGPDEPTLVHTRLAILDLSPAGAQPMVHRNQDDVLVFNGEIYNHLDVRRSLQRKTFDGHSDTETLLESIVQRGISATVVDSIGMFAFAHWNRKRRVLSLARDRLGIKPLYLWQHPEFLWFGSTLHAIPQSLRGYLKLHRTAVSAFIDCGYIPGSMSVFEGIQRVQPGSIVSLTIGEDGRVAREDLVWWRLDSHSDVFAGSEFDAVEQLDTLLRDAVELRMLSDVPIGAFLSGGIDSSAVVAVMQELSKRPVRTFCIRVDHPAFDESKSAEAIASHLGTEHHTLTVDSNAMVDLVPETLGAYDEPFADSSQFATFAVSRLAREHVTVCLSGDGGDELFHGYDRYQFVPKIWKIRNLLRFLPLALANKLPVSESVKRQLGKALTSDGFTAYYRYLDQAEGRSELLDRDFVNAEWKFVQENTIRSRSRSAWLSGIDTLNWLPDDILYKVDRASMAVGLEARVPILDHRIVEFARSLPQKMKVRDGQTKWPLRKVLEKRVPRCLFERKKQGFGLPIDQWLSTTLSDWAVELSKWSNPALPWKDGKLEAHVLAALQHRRWTSLTWRALAFQAWFKRFCENSGI